MAQGDKPTEALAKVERQIYETVGRIAAQLHADLKNVAPVDTGWFKANWRIQKSGELSWRIYNNVEYASVLWRGRHVIDGKEYGSRYWQNGGDPMLLKADIELSRQLELIRE